MDTAKQELLEIYRLHAELADKMSQRREGANRLYVSLITAFLIFLVASSRLWPETTFMPVVLVGGGIFGILLSVSWLIAIRSYRQLNSAKFKLLLELEEKLAYPFYSREWELLGEGKKASRYLELTFVETILPFCFIIIFISLLFFL